MQTLILFEDEHLLVVNKPAGMNTHAPAPFAGEGLYEWLHNREPRWASLAIIHRLDKETSGVMVFGKTAEANRSLTSQFANRGVHKTYHLLTDRSVPDGEFTVTSALVRAGERYLSRPLHAGGETAVTRFRVIKTGGKGSEVEAMPVTGRTHQIRAHAASRGFPVLGDILYGGSTYGRLCLHAARLEFKHPVSSQPLVFEVPPDFGEDPHLALRASLIDSKETDALRLIHGASGGWPGWYVDRLGGFLLSQSERPLDTAQSDRLRELIAKDRNGLERVPPRLAGAYHRMLLRQVRETDKSATSPKHAMGETAPTQIFARENGLQYELSFQEGYSVGLFLDQRDNRRRLLTGHVAAGFPLFAGGQAGRTLLNAFAYTCAFSVCAAKAGLRTLSLDLSKKYLEWGKRNFALNGLEAEQHDFIHGDVFDWLKRLAKRQRTFEVIVLDPPSFSRSKAHGIFRAEKDYPKLVRAALPLLAPQGVLLASTNMARYEPKGFLDDVRQTIHEGGRKVVQEYYAPQPPDFPVSREEPAYLKTVWLRIG